MPCCPHCDAWNVSSCPESFVLQGVHVAWSRQDITLIFIDFHTGLCLEVLRERRREACNVLQSPVSVLLGPGTSSVTKAKTSAMVFSVWLPSKPQKVSCRSLETTLSWSLAQFNKCRVQNKWHACSFVWSVVQKWNTNSCNWPFFYNLMFQCLIKGVIKLSVMIPVLWTIPLMIFVILL